MSWRAMADGAVWLVLVLVALPDCKREELPWQRCAAACAHVGARPLRCAPDRVVCDRAGLPVVLGEHPWK